jgi:hypothetical protein
MALLSLVTLGIWMDLAWPFFIGCAVAVGLLSYKYRMVSPTDLSRMGLAFGRINAYTSTTMLIATIAAISV